MSTEDDPKTPPEQPDVDDPSPGRESEADDAPLNPDEALEAAIAEAAEFKDRWVRERADLENVKRRATRDRQEALRYGAERLATDLLGVADNLERALAAAQAADGAQLVEGVQLVLKEFVEVLARHGVTRITAAGEPFDPAMHEAVAHLEHDTVPAGVVIEEHRGGYQLHDRLLRASMVSVSKGKSTDDLANPPTRD